MPAQKLQKKLPKRALNAKTSRAKSWERNKLNKKQRIKDNDKRYQDNLVTGCTGKMRATNLLHSSACFHGVHVAKSFNETGGPMHITH